MIATRKPKSLASAPAMGASDNRAYTAIFFLALLVALGLSLTGLIALAVFTIRHINPGALIAGVLLTAILYRQRVPDAVRRVVRNPLDVSR